ncbi:hypothetical protein AB0D92_34340 [Streptomyces parvus]
MDEATAYMDRAPAHKWFRTGIEVERQADGGPGLASVPDLWTP